MYPAPRELEKKGEYVQRFLSDKDVKDNIDINNRMKECNKLWSLSWKKAEVTVISSQGDFFINK